MPYFKLTANHIKTINNELDKAKQENKKKNLNKKLSMEKMNRFREK